MKVKKKYTLRSENQEEQRNRCSIIKLRRRLKVPAANSSTIVMFDTSHFYFICVCVKCSLALFCFP